MKDQHGLNLPLGSVKFMYILQQLSWCTVWHTHGTSMGILVLVRSPLLVCPSLHHSYAWPRWISRRPSQSCSGNLNGRSCLKPIWRIVCCTCEDVTNWEFLRNFDHISPLSGWSRELQTHGRINVKKTSSKKNVIFCSGDFRRQNGDITRPNGDIGRPPQKHGFCNSHKLCLQLTNVMFPIQCLLNWGGQFTGTSQSGPLTKRDPTVSCKVIMQCCDCANKILMSKPH